MTVDPTSNLNDNKSSLPGTSASTNPSVLSKTNQDLGKDFQLKLEPNDFIVFKTDKFPAEKDTAVEVKLTNNTVSLKCFKVIIINKLKI